MNTEEIIKLVMGHLRVERKIVESCIKLCQHHNIPVTPEAVVSAYKSFYI